MFEAYKYAKDKDLGYTQSAICWQESKAGTQLVNLGDPSFGRYHNLLSSVLHRVGVRDTLYYRNKFSNKLLTDHKFSSRMALAELEFWQSYHLAKTGKAGLWQKTVRSYNAGGNYSCRDSESYFVNIVNKIKALKKLDYFKGI